MAACLLTRAAHPVKLQGLVAESVDGASVAD
jgi:hypothetical protein